MRILRSWDVFLSGCTRREIVYAPGWVNSCSGLAMTPVPPSPKSHSYRWSSSLKEVSAPKRMRIGESVPKALTRIHGCLATLLRTNRYTRSGCFSFRAAVWSSTTVRRRSFRAGRARRGACDACVATHRLGSNRAAGANRSRPIHNPIQRAPGARACRCAARTQCRSDRPDPTREADPLWAWLVPAARAV